MDQVIENSSKKISSEKYSNQLENHSSIFNMNPTSSNNYASNSNNSIFVSNNELDEVTEKKSNSTLDSLYVNESNNNANVGNNGNNNDNFISEFFIAYSRSLDDN